MRILATADWHIQRPLQARGKDTLRAVDSIINYAAEYRPDVVLLGGDIHHSRTPSMTEQRASASRLKNLSKIAPTFVALGNHDISRNFNALDPAIEFRIENLFIPRSPKIYVIPDASIMVVPWMFPESLRIESSRSLSKAQKSSRIAKLVSEIVHFAISKADPNRPKILLAHATAFGAKFGQNRDTVLGSDPLWQAGVWKPFDLTVFGHIHKHQIVSIDPPVIYPGSPERTDFGARDEEKGFYTWETGQVPIFHMLESRPMVKLEGSIREVFDQIANAPDGAMLKGEVTLQQDETWPDVDIKRFFSFQLTEKRPRIVREKYKGIDAHKLTPPEVLKAYLDSTGKSKEEVAQLMGAFERLVEGD